MIAMITGLPRSRTYWLAEYFSGIDGITAYHEALNGIKSKQEFYDAMESPDYAINSDSGLFLTDWRERWPDAKCVVIHRPITEVYKSLCDYFKAQGYDDVKPSYHLLEDQLKAVAGYDGLHIAYDEINRKLPLIHAYLKVDYCPEYAERMTAQRLQIEQLRVDVDSYRLWDEFNKVVGER